MGLSAVPLFGRGEFRRSGAFQANIFVGRSDRYGNAEVSQHRLFEIVPLEEDITRCDITVDKSLLMYRLERMENAPQDPEGFLLIKQSFVW